MPEVNLLKDTANGLAQPKKPLAPGTPELTDPAADTGPGVLGMIKSLFHRGPRALPMAPPPPRAVGLASAAKSTSGERILSEKKHAPAAMIPLPEDEGGYNVNLLSDDLVSIVNPKQRAVLLGVIALAAALTVGLFFGGLVWYQGSVKNEIAATKTKLEAVDREISVMKNDQAAAATTVAKLNAIRTLVDRHTRWTKFFSLIERYTLPDVTYGPAFSGDLNGSVTLTGTTTSFEKVAQQYLIFQQLVREKRFISAFTLTGATGSTNKEGQSKTTFTVGLTLLPEDFTMTSEEFLSAANINASSLANPAGQRPGGISLGAASATDVTALICYLRDAPADISALPEFMRADIQSGVDFTAVVCTGVTAADKTNLATGLHTDADSDGINLFIENSYGTSDARPDSGQGQPDVNYIQQQYLSQVTPP